ncbi:MAG: DUF1232 domain-containing protein [Chloroflexi bacterium]|nr:DUF1232 domain-containing protein [Chloroflexota bacterium]
MLNKLRSIGRSIKHELAVYRLVLKDSRTPRLAKLLLALAIGYVLLPFYVIPDFIPVLGHVDDAIIVPLLIVLALRLVPREVVDNCRALASDM